MIKVTALNSHTATKVILYRIWVKEGWHRTDFEVRDVCSISLSWIKIPLRNYTACPIPHDSNLQIESSAVLTMIKLLNQLQNTICLSGS